MNVLIKFIGKKKKKKKKGIDTIVGKRRLPISFREARTSGNIIKAKHFAFSTRLVFVSSLARAIDRSIGGGGGRGGRAGSKAGQAKNENDLRSVLRVKSSFEPSFSRNRLRSTANRSNFSASRDASRAKRTLIREIES